MNKEVNVVDLFDEEMSKKEKKLNKKLEKARLKEEKRQKKLNKKLEVEENQGFQEYLEKWKSEKIETPVKEKEVTINPPVKEEIKSEKKTSIFKFLTWCIFNYFVSNKWRLYCL